MGKKKLYNLVDKRELKRQIARSDVERTTLSFYKYFPIEDTEAYRAEMYEAIDGLGALGRIYVSGEGVNGQITVPAEQLDAMRGALGALGMPGVRLNIAIEDSTKSFYKLIVRVREKIVADGLSPDEIDLQESGTHLSAAEFNALTDNPETILVDMRNHYESEVGHFEDAILPDVETFRDALPAVKDMLEDQKDHPVVMYCTGGIRCEKASAYLKRHGFEEVYQLDGGIIEYARQVRSQGLENKFKGKNFVFDERMGERIGDGIIASCHQCGAPCDTHKNCTNNACHILFIQCDACSEKYSACCSVKCADFIRLPDDEQKARRGEEMFNGSRFGRRRIKSRG